jgi:ion channel-forming bestrophin family protein
LDSENPFNYDLNDLDLDSFCIQIQRELHEITAHTSPEPSEFMFGPWNQPFAPADRRCADEIISAGENYTAPQNHSVDAGVPSLRATMLRNWREVEEAASHHKARY